MKTKKMQFISSNEYQFRLKKLGWLIKRNGSHIMAYSPDNSGLVTWSENNWNKNWREIARDLISGAKKNIGYSDLRFVFYNPFIIPNNFDYKTQSVVTEKNSEFIWTNYIMKDFNIALNKEICLDGKNWHKVFEINFKLDGEGLEFFVDSGEIIVLKCNDKVLIR